LLFFFISLTKYFQKSFGILSIRPPIVRLDSRAWLRQLKIRELTRTQVLEGDPTMRFMVIVKASKDSEAGALPSPELLTEMGKFNEELMKAGVLLAAEGLHPSSKGKRVRYSKGKKTVIDGPFAETKELIAGFWLWQCKSLDEAVDWVKRCPNPHKQDGEIEIRQVFETEDFAGLLTPEMREREERMRAHTAAKKGK
jgi:hypothetical protein